jgi:hypothetical protein
MHANMSLAAPNEKKRLPIVWLVGCFLLLPMSKAEADEPAPVKVNFSRQIRTILSDKCFKCHGPDENARKEDLRLDVRSAALEVLSPADPGDSEVIRRITSADSDERMPPAKAKNPLTVAEIELLERWIKEGAAYERHWAFSPIGKFTVPRVKNLTWPINEIDHFILRRLEAERLPLAPAAAKETLIRRLSFDLTGLPPTIAEIDAFVADDSKDAYEKLVDQLLARKAYGERMAADWLDVSRYSDTYGYQVDRDRFVWPWRDWVTRAFNANMPYDQFVTQQLAGDLLPDATNDQILATTFSRLHPQKVEGGSVNEEFRVEYVADRTQTFATAMLGLTLECCRCHDHKFDPIQQKEYYQLFAFFGNIDESGLYSYFTSSVPTPTLLMTDEAKKKEIAAAEQKIRDAEQALATVTESSKAAFDVWLNARPKEAAVAGLVKHLSFDNQGNGANKGVPGRVGKAVKLSGDDGIGTGVGNFRRYDPFSVTLWMNTPDVKNRSVIFHRSRAWTDAGSRGYQLLIEKGKLSASLIHFWPGNAIRVKTVDQIPIEKWIHVAMVYDGSSRADGLEIWIDGKPAKTEVVQYNLYKNISGGGGDNITIGERFRDRGFTNGLVDEFKVFNRRLTAIELAHEHDDVSLTTAFSKPAAALDNRSRAALYQFYLATTDAAYKEKLIALRAAREHRSRVVDGIQEIMVMRERQKPAEAYVLKRGAYDARLDRVTAGTPAVFPEFAKDQPRNRLGLARWLTRPDHPLTARVAVNRLWQMLFGAGFVRTPEDFGSQGQPPTHPELLDYLARDLIESGWDIKRLIKRIVMSATYRQSSADAQESRERDGENRYLARGPRYRWPAEMLRDNALAVSGLLVNKIGGPSVKPYEVEVSFKPTGRTKGEGLYRRSLYTYWKRTAPAPVMRTLDAAKREICTVKRESTSTPSAALVMLNGPQFVEASRVLAERMIQKHKADDRAIVVEMFRRALSTRPAEQEIKTMLDFCERQAAHFKTSPAEAEKLLGVGDRPRDKNLSPVRTATMTNLAIILLNTMGSTTKR